MVASYSNLLIVQAWNRITIRIPRLDFVSRQRINNYPSASSFEMHSSTVVADVGVRLRAAQYVRMSTDHQQYSPENQKAAIAVYAREHDIDIDIDVVAS